MLSALPTFADAPPRFVRLAGAGDGPVVLAPCTSVLMEPVVTHVLGLVQAGLDRRSASSSIEADLVSLLARLTLEGSVGSLRAGAVPGLTMVALAVAAVQGGRTVLGGLPGGLDDHLQGLRDAIDAAEPALVGRVLRDVSQRLQLTLDWASDAVVRISAQPQGLQLPRALLDDGLLLALPRVVSGRRPVQVALAAAGVELDPDLARAVLADPRTASDPAAAEFATALRRWDVGRALVDRLALLTPASSGGWIGVGGPLPDTPRARLLVPRGGGPIPAFVVALRLTDLEAHVEASSGGAPVTPPIEAAWHQLVADLPQVLHARHGSLSLSVFTSGLAAITFAERATRTLSGPRILDAGDLGGPVSVEAGVLVSAGIARGDTWGGTDGVAVGIDGAVVGRALSLSDRRPEGISGLRGIGREPGGGVHCDSYTCAALLAEAAADGRPVVDAASPGGPPVGDLPVRGWWESRGRRMVLLGSDSAVLVSMERDHIEALLARAALAAGQREVEDRAPELAEQLLIDDEAGERGEGLRPGRVGAAADPLATGHLIADVTGDLVDEPTADDRSVLTEHVVSPFRPVQPGAMDADTDVLSSPVEPGPLDEGTDALPAWDATGFSLPEFSQELNADELLAQLDAQADPHSYSLEVDDDYGFEEDAPAGRRRRTPVGLDTASNIDPLAHASPGYFFEQAAARAAPPARPGFPRDPGAPDFDVFAWPDPVDSSGTSEIDPLHSGEHSDGHSGSNEEVFALPLGLEDDRSAAADGAAADGAAADGATADGASGVPRADPPAALDNDRALPFVPPEYLAVSQADIDIEDEDGDFEDGDFEDGDFEDGDFEDGDFESRASDPAPLDVPPPVRQPDHTQPPPRRSAGAVAAREMANLFVGYVVVADGSGGFTFGLRDGYQLRDAHSYETGGDGDAAYRAFVQAKVAEGFVPRLDLWSPLPSEGRPEALDPSLLERAYLAMLTG